MTKILFAFLVSCTSPVKAAPTDAGQPKTAPADAGKPKTAPATPGTPAALGTSTVVVSNDSAADTVVFFSFGADSAITSWSFCPTTTRLNCQFPLKAHAKQPLPLAGAYLNATISFGAAVACNTTKGELNLNNPKWYDTGDVSMVDGYNGKIEITMTGATTVKLGPPLGKTGNEKVFGLFPLGCDICVARQKPPCGMKPGKSGCKAGPDQYHPVVPCQYQGTTKGGGSAVKVSFQGI